MRVISDTQMRFESYQSNSKMSKKLCICIFVGHALITFLISPACADKITELERMLHEMERKHQEEIDELKTQIAILKKTSEERAGTLVRENSRESYTINNNLNYGKLEKTRFAQKNNFIDKETPVPISKKEYIYSLFGKRTTFKGQFRVESTTNNFSFGQATVSNNTRSEAATFLRLRPTIVTEFSDDVSFELQAEFGNIIAGQRSTSGPDINNNVEGTYNGDAQGTAELRHAFFDFKFRPLDINARAGLIPWSDSFSDTLASATWDFNTIGFTLSKEINDVAVKIGTYKINELFTDRSDDNDLYTLDVDNALNNHLNIGASIYWMDDNSHRDAEFGNFTSNEIWIGQRFSYNFKKDSNINGWLLYNRGEIEDDDPGDPDLIHDGFAARLEGKTRFDELAFSIQGIFSSGDNNNSKSHQNYFRTISVAGEGYWSYTGLFTPWTPSDVADLAISLQNGRTTFNGKQQNLGLTTVQTKVEFPILKDLDGYFAAAHFWSSEENRNNGSRNIGTEIMPQLTYHFGADLKLDFGFSYAWLGDFFKESRQASSPDDLFQLFSRLQIEF